jgi:hypothetical protein
MYSQRPPEQTKSHKLVEEVVLEAQVLDDIRDARTKSSIDGGARSGIGEAPQSRRFKVVIGIIGLILLMLIISEFFEQTALRSMPLIPR